MAQPLDTELVPRDRALGRCLGEDIFTDRDYPPAPKSMMDGFAVRLEDAGKMVALRGTIPAGVMPKAVLCAGETVAIMTGAVCPDGCEAVVPSEDARVQGETVLLPSGLVGKQHIVDKGADRHKGALVLRVGDVLGPLSLAVLAAVGRVEVLVRRLARLGIIATGTEIVSSLGAVQPHELRSSNAPMVAAMLRSLTCEPPRITVAPDELGRLAAALEEMSDCDVVVFTGGASAGRFDLVPAALERYGAKLCFSNISQKPGKTLLFATAPGQLLFGLSGNPLGCHLGCHRYVSAAMRQLGGLGPKQIPIAVLSETVERRGANTWFALARGSLSEDRRQLEARMVATAGVADIFRSSEANAYIEIPPGTSPLLAGSPVELGWLSQGS